MQMLQAGQVEFIAFSTQPLLCEREESGFWKRLLTRLGLRRTKISKRLRALAAL